MAAPVRYKFTAITNCQVVRRDERLAKDVAVALGEELLPEYEVRIMQVPGAAAGTCVLEKREDGVDGGSVTVHPFSPFYVSVSAIQAGLVNTEQTPYAGPNRTP